MCIRDRCYSSQDSSRTTESYFTIFVDVYLKSVNPEETPYDLVCLATFLIGHDNYEVRLASMKLLKALESKYFGSSTTSDKFTESVCSKTKIVYKKALFDISSHLATLEADGSFIRISSVSYTHLDVYKRQSENFSNMTSLPVLGLFPDFSSFLLSSSLFFN